MEQTQQELQIEAGWSGVMSLPREVYLKGGDLAMKPAAEVKMLREKNHCFDQLMINSEQGKSLDNIMGDRLEIVAVVGKFDTGAIGFRVLASNDREEYTDIILDKFDNSLWIDTRNSSKLNGVKKGVYGDYLIIPVRNKMKVNIFIDKSTIEVFVNDQVVLTARAYQTREDSKGIELFARYGTIVFKSLNIWDLKSTHMLSQ